MHQIDQIDVRPLPTASESGLVSSGRPRNYHRTLSVDPAQMATPDGSHTLPLDEETVPMDICIIGGGVSGLSALQVIMGTPQYKSGRWKPTLFEARDKSGGVW